MRSAEPYQREPLLSRLIMTVPRGLNNGFGHISGLGYKSIVAPLLAFGAMAVGTETIYKALPNTSWSLPREERAFVPKIGVEDKPELGRLVPFKNAAAASVRFVAPAQLDQFVPTPAQKTVWFDPAFWAAVIICGAIQYQESKLFAKKDYAEIRKAATDANATRKITVNPQALDVARAKVAKHNAYGMGEETMSGGMVLLLYGVELAGFVIGFKGSTSWIAAAAWCAYTIIGFEIFYERKPPQLKQTPEAGGPRR